MSLHSKNRSAAWLAAACAFLALALFAFIAQHLAAGKIFAFDTPLMLWIHAHTGAWFLPLAAILHYAGKTALAVPLIALSAAWLAWQGRRAYALLLALGTLVPTLNMLAVKTLVRRSRPELWPRVLDETNFSFPSGHSTFAAALAVLAWIAWRHSPQRGRVLAAGLCFAALMGFSRVYLGVHYPSDVLAGWINGALTVAALDCFLFRKYLLR